VWLVPSAAHSGRGLLGITWLVRQGQQLMSSVDANAGLSCLMDRLEAVGEQCPSSTLAIYPPMEEHEQFFNDLCRIYVDASHQERRLIRDAVADKEGILNCLLGYVYESARQVRVTRDRSWLRIGLAAAAIQVGGYDYRDFLLALAELYVTAEEVGIDPEPEFEAMGAGIPADFHTYAVVRSRRARPK